MRPDQYGILYLALTSRCNLACSYCPVPKADISMPRLTAERGLDVLLHPRLRELRFFGGEPLLEFELIKILVERVQQSGHAGEHLLFRITTNGVLLDDEKLDFIEAHRNIQLVLSIDGAEKSHAGQRKSDAFSEKNSLEWFGKIAARIAALKRPVVANMVVCPQNVADMVENFAFIAKHGLRRVNILPAFYVEWSEDEISELRNGFRKTAALIDRLWSSGFSVEIENLHVNVEKPLFSGGLLLDCDGYVYSGDIAMLFHPGENRRRFSIGNITDINDLSALPEPPSACVDEESLFSRFSASALASTKQVDSELSHFVSMLRVLKSS